MSMGGIQWAVTVTHLPTGMKQTITNRDIRSQYKAKQRAIHILTNRVYYMSLLETNSDAPKQHLYDIQNVEDSYSEELWEYKVKGD